MREMGRGQDERDGRRRYRSRAGQAGHGAASLKGECRHYAFQWCVGLMNVVCDEHEGLLDSNFQDLVASKAALKVSRVLRSIVCEAQCV